MTDQPVDISSIKSLLDSCVPIASHPPPRPSYLLPWNQSPSPCVLAILYTGRIVTLNLFSLAASASTPDSTSPSTSSVSNSWKTSHVGGSGPGSSVVGKPLRARDCAFVRAKTSLNRVVRRYPGALEMRGMC